VGKGSARTGAVDEDRDRADAAPVEASTTSTALR
jgi:hypothetical protein